MVNVTMLISWKSALLVMVMVALMPCRVLQSSNHGRLGGPFSGSQSTKSDDKQIETQ